MRQWKPIMSASDPTDDEVPVQAGSWGAHDPMVLRLAVLCRRHRSDEYVDGFRRWRSRGVAGKHAPAERDPGSGACQGLAASSAGVHVESGRILLIFCAVFAPAGPRSFS